MGVRCTALFDLFIFWGCPKHVWRDPLITPLIGLICCELEVIRSNCQDVFPVTYFSERGGPLRGGFLENSSRREIYCRSLAGYNSYIPW